MMIDGVPDTRAGVRPLILSGKSTQQRGGDRNLKGAGRRHQRMFGQGTCATHSQAATWCGRLSGIASAASPSSSSV
jgi:hypothetical protein